MLKEIMEMDSKSPKISDPDKVKLYFQQYVLINENIKLKS